MSQEVETNCSFSPRYQKGEESPSEPAPNFHTLLLIRISVSSSAAFGGLAMAFWWYQTVKLGAPEAILEHACHDKDQIGNVILDKIGLQGGTHEPAVSVRECYIGQDRIAERDPWTWNVIFYKIESWGGTHGPALSVRECYIGQDSIAERDTWTWNAILYKIESWGGTHGPAVSVRECYIGQDRIAGRDTWTTCISEEMLYWTR